MNARLPKVIGAVIGNKIPYAYPMQNGIVFRPHLPVDDYIRFKSRRRIDSIEGFVLFSQYMNGFVFCGRLTIWKYSPILSSEAVKYFTFLVASRTTLLFSPVVLVSRCISGKAKLFEVPLQSGFDYNRCARAKLTGNYVKQYNYRDGVGGYTSKIPKVGFPPNS
jgi:hypothetical protein